MVKEHIFINNKDIKIPAIIWGKKSTKAIIAVHGDQSFKEDDVISLFAEIAVKKGYCVLSFDIPEHGERKNDNYMLNPQNFVSDLLAVYQYVISISNEISLFGCSIGAYFSLLAYKDLKIERSFFISPVVNMEKIIRNMMDGFQISENRLKMEKKIPLSIGKTLDWEYYTFVKQHPLNFQWKSPVYILYGGKDDMSERGEIEKFIESYHVELTIVDDAGHYFFTKKDFVFFQNWIKRKL